MRNPQANYKPTCLLKHSKASSTEIDHDFFRAVRTCFKSKWQNV